MDTPKNKRKVLAVDDEIAYRHTYQRILKKEGYEVITAADGVIASQILRESYKEIDLVLLDRMMPNMNGMELLAIMKQHAEIKDIPVIMVTGAFKDRDVAEGIKAGAYYYLTKPFDNEVLLAIMDAAIRDHDYIDYLKSAVGKHKQVLQYFKEGRLEITTVEEAEELAIYLANFYPEPVRVVFGISELLLNAIEHGNLGIGYQKKGEYIRSKTWLQEIEKLQSLPENKAKKVVISFKHSEDNIKLSIKDEGEGFTWRYYLDITPERTRDLHGRGIAMSNKVSFDKIEYLGCGNEVLCTVNTKL